MTVQLALALDGGAEDGPRPWTIGDRVKCRYGAAIIVGLHCRIDGLDGEFIAVKPDRLADEFLLRARELSLCR